VGGDFREIEAIERRLGIMSPTLDGVLLEGQDVKRLATADPGQAAIADVVKRLAAADPGQAAIADVVADQPLFKALGRLVRVLWAAREALTNDLDSEELRPLLKRRHVVAVVAEIDAAVPRKLAEQHMQLDDWDIQSEALPPLRWP
jgi:hypothetical protein